MAHVLAHQIGASASDHVPQLPGSSELIEQVDGSHKTKQADSIATNFRRIVRKGLGIDRPYSLHRKSGASKLDEHSEFGRYAEHYLGEKPSTVANRHYITPSQDRFDAAIAWLGKQYEVECEAVRSSDRPGDFSESQTYPHARSPGFSGRDS